MCIFVCVCIHVHLCMCVFVFLCVYICMPVCVYICAYAYMCVQKLQKKRFLFISPSILLISSYLIFHSSLFLPTVTLPVSFSLCHCPFPLSPCSDTQSAGLLLLGLSLCLPLGAPLTQHPVSLFAWEYWLPRKPLQGDHMWLARLGPDSGLAGRFLGWFLSSILIIGGGIFSGTRKEPECATVSRAP